MVNVKRKGVFYLLITSFFIILLSLSYLYVSNKTSSIRVEPHVNHVVQENYDIIVVGGGPEGVTAAVSAARNGAEVLLIEERDALGGLFTFGELNYLDIPKDQNGTITSAGIFKEWWKLVDQETTFDIDKAKQAFLYLIQQEENITLALSTTVTNVEVDQAKIQRLETSGSNGTKTFYADRYIDATENGDLAASAGVPFTTGQEDIGKKDAIMAATMMIVLDNVNWTGVKQTAKSGMFGEASANGDAAWGFSEINSLYEEHEEDVNLRGLNIGRSPSGLVYINALQIFGVNGLDESQKKAAIEKGKRETQHIVQFLNETFPGFEDATIASYPDELYIRETRHMDTLYRVTASDLWEHKIPKDTIAYGGYPVDIQATTPHELGIIVFNPSHYGIPLRSLVPKHVTNLLIASKASGYDSIPAGSIRVVPTGMAVAEASGVAASLSAENDIDFPELIKSNQLITKVQETLKRQNAYLPDYDESTYPYQGDPDYESIRKLYSLGLISAGYNNELPLDRKLKVETFSNWLRQVIGQVHADDATKQSLSSKILAWSNNYALGEHLTTEQVEEVLSLFPDVMQQANWIYDIEGDYTYREGYRALAMWIP